MRVFDDVLLTTTRLARYAARPVMMALVESIRKKSIMPEPTMADCYQDLEKYKYSGQAGSARMPPPKREHKDYKAVLAKEEKCPHNDLKEYSNWAGTFKICTLCDRR